MRSFLLITMLMFLILVVHAQEDPYCKKSGVFTKKVQKSGITCDLLVSDSVQIDLSSDNHTARQLSIRYLGCGGFYIGDERTGILLDPFFSYVDMLKVGFGKMNTISENVDMGIKPIKEKVTNTVAGVFVAHSHYDHLMDVPYLMKHYLKEAQIHTSVTGRRILDTYMLRTQIHQLPTASSDGEILDSIYLNDERIRVTVVSTNHAPHFGKIKLASGELKQRHVDKFEAKNYSRFGWWKEGGTYSFLIDFLDERGEIDFRIYHQSSASNGTGGFLPEQALDEQGEEIDLVILGAASYKNVKNYPEALYQNLGSPQRMIICHWEGFFRDYKKPPKKVIATPVNEFVYQVNKCLLKWKVGETQQVFLPVPGAAFRVLY